MIAGVGQREPSQQVDQLIELADTGV